MTAACARIALAALACAAFDSAAVRLDPEGGGQALIYPYYTVRSYGADPFNTYLSLVNTTADGKALRVRIREGEEGFATLELNLFLAPNDAWTAALVPTTDGGTQLVSADRSCATYAKPADATGLYRQALSAASFAADGVDRTREGYVEVFEMGTVKGATLAAISPDASGAPRDCGAVQLRDVASADIAAPGGGLQGTLTLINVASGMDATLNAEALADLASKPYYRNVLDSYPDWNIAEIDPVSYVRTPTHAYRLVWASGLQAVSSLLMRPVVTNEFAIDAAVAGATDWVVTFPTRRLQVSATAAIAPFGSPTCERAARTVLDREAREQRLGSCEDMGCSPPPPFAACAASNVLSFAQEYGDKKFPLFGSKLHFSGTDPNGSITAFPFQNGALRVGFTGAGPQAGLVSQPTSTRLELATGKPESRAFQVQGLPAVGFMARAFTNGTLACGSGLCQGNYASAFGHHGSPAIVPVQ